MYFEMMKKGELLRKILDDPESEKIAELNEKFLLIMGCAYQECEKDFSKLDGLTWPRGLGVLISKSKQQIENSFESASVKQIYHSPYYAEVGQSKKDLKRIVEMAFVELGYPAGLRNEARNFIEPPPTINLLAIYQNRKIEETE